MSKLCSVHHALKFKIHEQRIFKIYRDGYNVLIYKFRCNIPRDESRNNLNDFYFFGIFKIKWDY